MQNLINVYSKNNLQINNYKIEEKSDRLIIKNPENQVVIEIIPTLDSGIYILTERKFFWITSLGDIEVEEGKLLIYIRKQNINSAIRV